MHCKMLFVMVSEPRTTQSTFSLFSSILFCLSRLGLVSLEHPPSCVYLPYGMSWVVFAISECHLERKSIPAGRRGDSRTYHHPQNLSLYSSNGSIRRLSMGGIPRVQPHEVKVEDPLIDQSAS